MAEADHQDVTDLPPPRRDRSFTFSRSLFIRLLGVVYLCAFASMGLQVRGLFGDRGVLPVGEYLEAVHGQLGAGAYWRVPTVFWLGHSDAALVAVCAAGVGLAAALIAGAAPAAVLAVLWALYLSIVSVGQEFLGFQWDTLLLEAGFIAIFFAPLRLTLGRARGLEPSPAIRLLVMWLLFRLMVSAGLVKLLSGDPTWRNLTAMQYHYETQPIPAWTSWYLHQLPPTVHKVEVVFAFAIELAAPFMIFGPPVLRRAAFVMLAALQALIMASGNFGFFNLLTVALAVPLLDDAALPRRWRGEPLAREPAPQADVPRRAWASRALVAVAVALFVISIVPFSASLGVIRFVPSPLVRLYLATQPLGLSSSYGLFAIMTTQRPEIVIEGSDDGVMWRAYEFKYKPGDVTRRPPLIGPHMPRLDWQMWFAALGNYHQNPWLGRLLERLREGSPEVLGLLERNPFPDAPPKYVRATLYDYHFTSAKQKREAGAWWKRRELGPYAPTR